MSYANNQLNDQRYMYDWIVKNDCKKKKEHVFIVCSFHSCYYIVLYSSQYLYVIYLYILISLLYDATSSLSSFIGLL